MANRFKTHAITFLDWALSDKCPYVWYDGLWYYMPTDKYRETKGITTAELYEIWTSEKP